MATEEKTIISFLHRNEGAARPPKQGGSVYIKGVPDRFTLMIYNNSLQEY